MQNPPNPVLDLLVWFVAEVGLDPDRPIDLLELARRWGFKVRERDGGLGLSDDLETIWLHPSGGLRQLARALAVIAIEISGASVDAEDVRRLLLDRCVQPDEPTDGPVSVTPAPTVADLRLALARLLLLSMWQADETDDGNAEAIAAVDAEIERIEPLFAGIMDREQLTNWLVDMNQGKAVARARNAALLVCEAAA